MKNTNPNIEYKQEEFMLMMYEIDSCSTQKILIQTPWNSVFSLDSLFLVGIYWGQN